MHVLIFTDINKTNSTSKFNGRPYITNGISIGLLQLKAG